MSNKTLFIPGTGGTQLLKNGVSLGHPMIINLRLFLLKTIGVNIEETVADMSMEHKVGQIAPVKTTLAENAQVTSGPSLTAAYNLILEKIPLAFSYDWRGDIEYSAQLLIDYLKENKPAKGRWRLVAHSQGGLVALVASQLYQKQTKQPFSTLVSHLLLVAVPIYGSLNAANALVEGRDLGQAPAREFRQIAGTWPSLYQMLPDFPAIRTEANAPSPYTFLHTKTWSPYSWILPDLVRRAVEFKKAYLRYPTVGLHNIYYSHLLLTNKPTWDSAIRQNDGFLRFDKEMALGDGLVPSDRTIARMTDVEQQRKHVVALGENTPEHAMVFTDDFVVTRVMDELDSIS